MLSDYWIVGGTKLVGLFAVRVINNLFMNIKGQGKNTLKVVVGEQSRLSYLSGHFSSCAAQHATCSSVLSTTHVSTAY